MSHTVGAVQINFSSLKNLTELTLNDNLLITDQVCHIFQLCLSIHIDFRYRYDFDLYE